MRLYDIFKWQRTKIECNKLSTVQNDTFWYQDRLLVFSRNATRPLPQNAIACACGNTIYFFISIFNHMENNNEIAEFSFSTMSPKQYCFFIGNLIKENTLKYPAIFFISPNMPEFSRHSLNVLGQPHLCAIMVSLQPHFQNVLFEKL